MRMLTVALLAALVSIAPTAAVAQVSASHAGMSISAQTIEISRATNQIVATGKVHVEASNKLAKTYFVADASKMVITAFTNSETKGALNGMDAIKHAVFSGPVKMLYVAPKLVKNEATGKTSEVSTKLTANSDEVTFSGPEGVVYLTGNVLITNDDPSMFAAPATMTGEKASINLKKNDESSGPDFKIESPNGVSKIEAVPNPRQKATKKK